MKLSTWELCLWIFLIGVNMWSARRALATGDTITLAIAVGVFGVGIWRLWVNA